MIISQCQQYMAPLEPLLSVCFFNVIGFLFDLYFGVLQTTNEDCFSLKKTTGLLL